MYRRSYEEINGRSLEKDIANKMFIKVIITRQIYSLFTQVI